MEFYMDPWKTTKISSCIQKICMFGEYYNQHWIEAVARLCNRREKKDSVLIFTHEKLDYVSFQRLRHKNKRKELRFTWKKRNWNKWKSFLY